MNNNQQPTQPYQQQPVQQQPVQQPVQQMPTQPVQQQPIQQQPAQPQQPLTPDQQQKVASTHVTQDSPVATQSTLLISELRDSLVIMKDGSFRAVVACKSINFDLMSAAEREGVEYSYQNFLNSLTFTIQILVRSQRVDIGPYLERLSNIRRNNDNMLLGVLMDDYINFIDILSQEANIMDKSFFIVIPYYSSKEAEKSPKKAKISSKLSAKPRLPKSLVLIAIRMKKPSPRLTTASSPSFLASSKLASSPSVSILKNSANFITTSTTPTPPSANHLVIFVNLLLPM